MSDQEPNQENDQQPLQQVPPVSGVVTTVGNVEIQADDSSQDDDKGRDFEAEIAKLRKENAKWRTQFREAEKQVKELSPAAQKLAELEESQKTEEQKLRERLATIEAKAQAAEASAALALKEKKLALLASKANVNPELVELLDINKLDFDDEAAILEKLQQFTQKPALNGGGASDPSTPDNSQPSEQDLVSQYFRRGGQGVSIFGS